jgi:hypothetical protein
MNGALRQYVPHYAKKSEPLQLRKTELLRGSPIKGRPRKDWSVRTAYLQFIHYVIAKSHVLLHAWVTVYANSHYSAADTEAAIELRDSDPAARGRSRGRPHGRRPHAEILARYTIDA